MQIFPRRHSRTWAGAVAIAACALLLSGCVQPDPAITPQLSPSAKPLFASDADALAAATKAYAAYLKMSNQILVDGGSGIDRIEGLASRKALADQRSSAKSFKEKGYTSVGEVSFSNPTLQHFSHSMDGIDAVTIYVCLDVSKLDVVDASGQSAVSATRPDRQAFEVSFDERMEKPKGLVVASTDAWSGVGICGQ
jgi:hypothetical protein